MKKTILLFAAIVMAGTVVISQNKSKDDLAFEKTLHDYGSVVYGADGTYDFTFKNTSDKPVVLTDVKSSCGCTVPTWSKDPIQPGATSKISVLYNTKLAGPFNKTVSVYHTGNNSPVRLSILGRVNAQPSDIKPNPKAGTVLPPAEAQKQYLKAMEEKYGKNGKFSEGEGLPPAKAAKKAAFEKRKAESGKTTTKTGKTTKAGEGGKIKK